MDSEVVFAYGCKNPLIEIPPGKTVLPEGPGWIITEDEDRPHSTKVIYMLAYLP